MPRGFWLSLLLHLALFLIIVFGFPMIMPDKEFEPSAITVEILPMSELTNIKPSQKPISVKEPAPQKTSKPTPATQKEPPKPKEPEPKKPDPVPEKPKEEVKPKEPDKPKEPEKPKEDTKPKEDDFDKLMSQLETEKTTDDKTPEKPKENTADTTKSKSDAPYDPTQPLSISEKDAIRSQFVKCWRMPAGARADYSLAVRVRVLLNQDGSVQKVGLVPDQVSRYQSDTFFRAAADSALRAVQLCSPLKNLPPDKFGSWRDLELNFDPQEMLY